MLVLPAQVRRTCRVFGANPIGICRVQRFALAKSRWRKSEGLLPFAAHSALPNVAYAGSCLRIVFLERLAHFEQRRPFILFPGIVPKQKGRLRAACFIGWAGG